MACDSGAHPGYFNAANGCIQHALHSLVCPTEFCHMLCKSGDFKILEDFNILKDLPRFVGK